MRSNGSSQVPRAIKKIPPRRVLNLDQKNHGKWRVAAIVTPLSRQGFINEQNRFSPPYWFKIVQSVHLVLEQLPDGAALLCMKTCERFERRLDQLRMGACQSRKARQSSELLPMNNLWPLERRFDHPPRTSMRQCSNDSVCNSPATLKALLSPVTNKERHTQDCEADAVHRQRQ